jgi:hypothetical protein
VALTSLGTFACGVERLVCCQFAMPVLRWWLSRRLAGERRTGVAEIRSLKAVTGGQYHAGRRMAAIRAVKRREATRKRQRRQMLRQLAGQELRYNSSNSSKSPILTTYKTTGPRRQSSIRADGEGYQGERIWMRQNHGQHFRESRLRVE